MIKESKRIDDAARTIQRAFRACRAMKTALAAARRAKMTADTAGPITEFPPQRLAAIEARIVERVIAARATKPQSHWVSRQLEWCHVLHERPSAPGEKFAGSSNRPPEETDQLASRLFEAHIASRARQAILQEKREELISECSALADELCSVKCIEDISNMRPMPRVSKAVRLEARKDHVEDLGTARAPEWKRLGSVEQTLSV